MTVDLAEIATFVEDVGALLLVQDIKKEKTLILAS